MEAAPANSWSEVDAWKRRRIAAAAELRAGDALVRNNIRQIRAEKRMRKNVERWFRQLPAELVHAAVLESRASAEGIAVSSGFVAVLNDWLLARGFTPHKHLPRRAPVDAELALIKALKACRFPPASFSKRFARDLSETAVTDGQVAQVRRLVAKFRKQIPAAALHEADRHLLKSIPRRGK